MYHFKDLKRNRDKRRWDRISEPSGSKCIFRLFPTKWA